MQHISKILSKFSPNKFWLKNQWNNMRTNIFPLSSQYFSKSCLNICWKVAKNTMLVGLWNFHWKKYPKNKENVTQNPLNLLSTYKLYTMTSWTKLGWPTFWANEKIQILTFGIWVGRLIKNPINLRKLLKISLAKSY